MPKQTYDCIALKEKRAQQSTNLSPRMTEMAAMFGGEPGTSAFHVQLVTLFNIATLPRLYPDVSDKPKQALRGDALWRWIAVRLGITAAEVRLYLAQ